MDQRKARYSAEARSPCKCCGRIVDMSAVEPIGIMERTDGEPPVILYQCECNNTLAIPWAQAPEEMKERVRKAKKDLANLPK